MSQAEILLLWDVDHTLIENGGVSKDVYGGAFRLLTGVSPTKRPETDGRTDLEIVTNLLTAHGFDAGEYGFADMSRALLEAMREQRDALASRGWVLPGAREALEIGIAHKHIHQTVLTGNIEQNARAKLATFGIDTYVDFDVGGFGSDDVRRPQLVAHAQQKARKRLGLSFGESNTVLVGDTTRDVEAALHGGARILAVATGSDSPGMLSRAGAHAVMDDLRDTDAVLKCVVSLTERL